MHGLRRRQAHPRRPNEMGPHPGTPPLRLRRHILRRLPHHNPGERRPLRNARHPPPRRNPNRILRLDLELPKTHHERARGAQTAPERPNVPAALVGAANQHLRNLRLLLPQLAHVRRPQQPRLRAHALENALVRPRRLAQPRLPRKPNDNRIPLASNREQPTLRNE